MSTTRWQESTTGFTTIDREAGVIRGVKVLGLQSKNKRRYLKEAAEAAIPKYEGRKIYVDHINVKEGTERKTRERWGKLSNVTANTTGELYGDLHYLKTHPMTEQILEAAERFNDFGLSHDAGGRTRKENGEDVIHEIAEVYSVDVVQEPATNRNLFESQQMKTKKVMQALREHIKQPHAANLLARMTEMEDIYDESMMMDTMDGATPGDEVNMAFRTAIMSIVDGDMDMKAKMEKIQMLLDVQQQIATKQEPEGDDMSKEVMEQLQSRNSQLEAELTELKEAKQAEETRANCHKMLEDDNREATEVRVKALMKLDAEDRKALVESWDPRKTTINRPGTSPSRFTESSDKSKEDFPADTAGLKKLFSL